MLSPNEIASHFPHMPAIPPIAFTIEKSEIFYECPVIPDKKKMLSYVLLGFIYYLSSAGMNRFQLLKTYPCN
jgi:hypothetical protein